MAWYWIALIAGVIAPWVVMGQALVIAFQRGLIEGLGVWFGISLLTVPFMLAFIGVSTLVL